MINTTNTTRRTGRVLKAAVAIVTIAMLAACNDFLTAENPGAVEEPDVNDPAYINLIANGAIFGFQEANDDVVWWNAQFTDEIVNRAASSFIEEGQIDRRELYSDMTYIPAFIYSNMQRARFLGDDASRRLKLLLADSANTDLRVARSLAFAGYGRVVLGETFCVTPIDLGVPKTTEEMMTDAIANFQEAITIANAAKAKAQSRPTSAANTLIILGSDSVRNFALVGASRAAMNKNDKTAAAAFAAQVPADFVFNLWYSDNSTAQNNRTYNRITLGKNGWLLFTPFEAMAADPRVPRILTTSNAGTPLSPESYTTWNNNVVGANFAPIMGMRIASGLEARYVIAEANGPVASTLTFVNERRAVGLQPPVNLTGDALMAELRDQRARDFYLDGRRLGDLRRYKKYYNVDLFPKGPYPGTTTGQIYNETITCWPLPTNEINANPNIPKS
jgi:hypothetical protein